MATYYLDSPERSEGDGGIDIHDGSDTVLGVEDLPVLTTLLKTTASQWKTIGIALGFVAGDEENISATPGLINDGPVGYFRELMTRWLRWAPPVHYLPTIGALASALRAAGQERLAYDLPKKFQEKKWGDILSPAESPMKGPIAHQHRRDSYAHELLIPKFKSPLPTAHKSASYVYPDPIATLRGFPARKVATLSSRPTMSQYPIESFGSDFEGPDMKYPQGVRDTELVEKSTIYPEPQQAYYGSDFQSVMRQLSGYASECERQDIEQVAEETEGLAKQGEQLQMMLKERKRNLDTHMSTLQPSIPRRKPKETKLAEELGRLTLERLNLEEQLEEDKQLRHREIHEHAKIENLLQTRLLHIDEDRARLNSIIRGLNHRLEEKERRLQLLQQGQSRQVEEWKLMLQVRSGEVEQLREDLEGARAELRRKDEEVDELKRKEGELVDLKGKLEAMIANLRETLVTSIARDQQSTTCILNKLQTVDARIRGNISILLHNEDREVQKIAKELKKLLKIGSSRKRKHATL